MTQFYNEYSKVLVSVDCIIFGFDGSNLQVLIGKRKMDPGRGEWSLYGGFVGATENLEDAANRVILELTGMKNLYIRQVGAFGRIDRDPGERVISIAYCTLINVKEADAFSAEVKNLNVYVFDKNGKFVDNYTESADKFETGHKMEITDLQAGKYTFVCLARDKQPAAMGTRAEGDDETEFSFTKLTPGISTINDLQEEMGKKNEEESVNDKHFTALYTAQDSLNFDGENDVQGKLSLMKCTKTYRVVMLPFEPDQEGFTAENFDVEIKGSAALLDYKGDKVKPKAITYLPYEKKLVENHSGKTEVEGEDVEKALVYDLSSSRMFETKDDNKSRAADGSSQYDDKRIVITDKRINKVIFNHSLPWFLSLCASDRYGKDWSDQQYLDRQDHYTLVFYVPAPSSTYSMDARIKVNNWVLNLQNADLGK